MTNDLNALLGRLDLDLVVRLARDLVAIPSENPPGQERACAEFIHTTLTRWGVEAEMVPAPDPARPQVIAWHRGPEGGPTLILNGHMDTVPAGDRGAWTHPPFDAVIKDGRLYALGAADMKGALAAAMVVMKTLHETRPALNGTVMFQAVMGEEMDEPGTRTLLRRGYTGDWALVLEPTDLRIGPVTRGACWHKVRIETPSMHCGLAPGDLKDATDVLRDFSTALARYHDGIARRRHDLIAPPACRITRIESGTAHNSTAGRCELLVDRRMLPGEAFEDVTRELRDIFAEVHARHPDSIWTIEPLEWNEPTQTPLDDPLITGLEAGFAAVRGQKPAVWGPPYGSDMRNFVHDSGIPATNFGPGDFRVCHRPDEFVALEDLRTCAAVVLATAVDLLTSRPTC